MEKEEGAQWNRLMYKKSSHSKKKDSSLSKHFHGEVGHVLWRYFINFRK